MYQLWIECFDRAQKAYVSSPGDMVGVLIVPGPSGAEPSYTASVYKNGVLYESVTNGPMLEHAINELNNLLRTRIEYKIPAPT